VRVTLATSIALALLAFSPCVARADDRPEFDVLPFATGLNKIADTELDLSFPKTGTAPARVSIAVPAAFGLAPAAVGSTVAHADIDVFMGGKTTTIGGNVIVDDPARYVTNTCAPGTHSSVWVLFLTVAGQPYVIPIYVDASPTQPPTLQWCLLSPDVPQGAGGAPGGARLTYIGLEFHDSFRNPPTAGAYLWSATVTPFTTGTGDASPTTTYELRAVEALPASLTTKSRYDAKHKVTVISGRLARSGANVGDIHVHVFAATSILGSYKEIAATYTDSHGAYSVKKKLKQTEWIATYVRQYIGDCMAPSTAPAGCVLQSYSPVLGDIARAVVPKPKKQR